MSLSLSLIFCKFLACFLSSHDCVLHFTLTSIKKLIFCRAENLKFNIIWLLIDLALIEIDMKIQNFFLISTAITLMKLMCVMCHTCYMHKLMNKSNSLFRFCIILVFVCLQIGLHKHWKWEWQCSFNGTTCLLSICGGE